MRPAPFSPPQRSRGRPGRSSSSFRCSGGKTVYHLDISPSGYLARMLHGWAEPDIVTLRHRYRVTADSRGVYVSGWSGKVQRLVLLGPSRGPQPVLR